VERKRKRKEVWERGGGGRVRLWRSTLGWRSVLLVPSSASFLYLRYCSGEPALADDRTACGEEARISSPIEESAPRRGQHLTGFRTACAGVRAAHVSSSRIARPCSATTSRWSGLLEDGDPGVSSTRDLSYVGAVARELLPHPLGPARLLLLPVALGNLAGPLLLGTCSHHRPRKMICHVLLPAVLLAISGLAVRPWRCSRGSRRPSSGA